MKPSSIKIERERKIHPLQNGTNMVQTKNSIKMAFIQENFFINFFFLFFQGFA